MSDLVFWNPWIALFATLFNLAWAIGNIRVTRRNALVADRLRVLAANLMIARFHTMIDRYMRGRG